MAKKLLILFLCGIILFCFVACSENNMVNTTSSENLNDIMSNSEKHNNPTESVFNTENIVRITFYSYYGKGNGSDVPSAYMTEIINWLDSFTIEKEVDSALDGTNTYYVEIEYSDGTVIKEGLDLIVVDGTAYYIKGDKQPECFMEIISKESLKK